MTRRRNLKRRVRALMDEHGLPYTAALAALTGSTDHRSTGSNNKGEPNMREVKVQSVTTEWSEEEAARMREVRPEASASEVFNQAMVALEEVDGGRVVRIWTGRVEAFAIRGALDAMPLKRPLPPQLFVSAIELLDSAVVAMRVTRNHEYTYFAELDLAVEGGVRTLDARPSDAIAIALLSRAPLSVAEDLLSLGPPAQLTAPSPPTTGGDAGGPTGG